MKSIGCIFLILFVAQALQANQIEKDRQVAEQCLVDAKKDHQFIIINKYQKKRGNKPAFFQSYVFDRKKGKWVDRFESLAGEGGIGCHSQSMKTPPGILEIKAEGSKKGAEHWAFDRTGNRKYFMDDISGSICDTYAKEKGLKHRSHQRQIRFHSNKRMKRLTTNNEQSKGCFVLSPQKFKQWGGGRKESFPGNAIVYNVPPKGMKFAKIKCRPGNTRLLTQK